MKCENTLDGARIATHCLYPSFETVYVYVVKMGDDYRVHDGGGAYRSAWAHGRDHLLVSRLIDVEAKRFQLHHTDDSLISRDVSIEWLAPAILSVANASSRVAIAAAAKASAVVEEALVEKIDRILSSTVASERIARNFAIRGKSGGDRHFDFAVRGVDGYDLLINGVSAHHASISAKFVSFSDTENEQSQKFAVYERELAADDTALLQQVATVVPLRSLQAGTRRVMQNA
ncbi:hypothetical protein [Methylovirgula sp. 4M-Z18]|uniref:hypothetical protein n=1 Tax=Methylovirgula sp. 4M-Z18 TaxID=2293567 RepID=UPI0011C0417E|nr:hypothetical protein [Methylovirgula sp. 4M-Z18]